ncbi:MAG: Gfo/Idh/MocA family oxidoreductase, partial [Calditrichia bacterium]|nr:Gfo/Idh/MocA family oxidoreductase [Calditrichia bacterium]
QNLLKREELDGIFICTPNNFHYPMALASLDKGIPTLVEKPVALNSEQAQRLHEKAKSKDTLLVVGMNYRFRDDAMILKEFMRKGEIGEPFYVKTGWLRHWSRPKLQTWLTDSKISGGGVLMDMGIQLIDLSLWLLGTPKVKNVCAYSYNLFREGDVEDSALAIIQTENDEAITVEVSWRMHLEKDMNYAHVFGKEGSAFMNPLRLYKEMHGNLVNVTPVEPESNVDVYKKSFFNEIKNFINVIKGEEEPVTPIEDGVYLMKILDAIYQSAKNGQQIDLAG